MPVIPDGAQWRSRNSEAVKDVEKNPGFPPKFTLNLIRGGNDKLEKLRVAEKISLSFRAKHSVAPEFSAVQCR
jgi:hypothetical protein